MNQKDLSDSVIPGLTRNPTTGSAGPAVRDWIPAPQECSLRRAFAGMTWLSIVFFMPAYLTVIATGATPDDEREYGVEGGGERSRKFLAA